MAIRFPTAADALTRDGTFLDLSTSFTRAGWVWFPAQISAPDEYTAWNVGQASFYVWIGGAAPSTFGFTDPGLLLAEESSSSTPEGGVTQSGTAGQWAYVGQVYDGVAKTLGLVVNGTLIGTESCDLSAVTPKPEETAGPAFVNDIGGNAVAYLRVWQAALSVEELAAEMPAETAVRTADLLADTPLRTTINLADVSGHGRDWTLIGAITDFPGPLPTPVVFTDQALLTEIQDALLEPPDGGATWPSGLWTQAEVLAAMNERQNRFLKSALLLVGLADLPPTPPFPAGQHRIDLPEDWLATLSVVWEGADGTLKEIPRGDTFEMDHGLQTWENERGTPALYTDEETPNLLLCLAPAPNVSGIVHLTYVPQGAPLDGTGESLTVPGEFAHAASKYGPLADLLGKDGRGRNPQKAAYCETRYQLGLDCANLILHRSWV